MSDSKIQHATSVPIGTIVAWAGSTNNIPNGWLYCNGQNMTNGASGQPGYALFQAIGTQFGGTGDTNFYLPDLRGYFLRGMNDGTGRDPDAQDRSVNNPSLGSGNTGDAVGSLEMDAVNATASTTVPVQYIAQTGEVRPVFGYNMHNLMAGYFPTQNVDPEPKIAVANAPATSAIGVPAGGTTMVSTEVRPKNVNVIYIIYAGI